MTSAHQFGDLAKVNIIVSYIVALGLFIWEAGRDVCRDGTFFIPALKTVYMGYKSSRQSGTECLYDKNCPGLAGMLFFMF